MSVEPFQEREVLAIHRKFDLLLDSDPEKSLALSARSPNPVYESGIFEGPIDPLKKWCQIGRAMPLWSAETRALGRLLNLGKSKLPTWKQILAFYERLGLEALPVTGFVPEPLYTHLIAHGRIPVCTKWALRHRTLPYYVVPVDTIHDLSHGLALCQDDYRSMLTDFSVAALATGSYLLSEKYYRCSIRLFERSCAFKRNGSLEPIGSGTFALDTVKLEKGKLMLKSEDLRVLKATDNTPFDSREKWGEKTLLQIELLRSMSKPSRRKKEGSH
jgi:hypothetical protein